jgi:protein-S-isoprenylcysteine O-methyltransferase Ste14
MKQRSWVGGSRSEARMTTMTTTMTKALAVPVVPWWKGRRGEWYVVVQVALLLLIVFGPSTAAWLPAWPGWTEWLTSPIAAALIAGGIGWIIAGAAQLALVRSLSALPSPTTTGRLVDTGAFAFVRHPMYCGGIWAVLGCGLWSQGVLTIGYAAALALFFDLKATREEQALSERFPEYADYKTRVRKLTPFIY